MSINWLKAYDWTADFIRNLPLDEWQEIDKLPVKDKAVFVICAKQYIDIYKDAEFSNDYTKIKRIWRMTP